MVSFKKFGASLSANIVQGCYLFEEATFIFLASSLKTIEEVSLPKLVFIYTAPIGDETSLMMTYQNTSLNKTWF